MNMSRHVHSKCTEIVRISWERHEPQGCMVGEADLPDVVETKNVGHTKTDRLDPYPSNPQWQCQHFSRIRLRIWRRLSLEIRAFGFPASWVYVFERRGFTRSQSAAKDQMTTIRQRYPGSKTPDRPDQQPSSLRPGWLAQWQIKPGHHPTRTGARRVRLKHSNRQAAARFPARRRLANPPLGSWPAHSPGTFTEA